MKNTSVHAFMNQLIDYAGLFPPASLPLESAIRSYVDYRKGRDAWMLGRFIINASRLDELDPFVHLFSQEMPLAVSALGHKSDSEHQCLVGLQADLEQIAAFCNRHGETVNVEVLELPLPPLPIGKGMLNSIALESSQRGLHTFCEVAIPRDADWERNLYETLDAVAFHNSSGGPTLGVKIRTGGVTADAFPTPAQVAAALLGCRDRGITMKFTAGLHHPIRMFRSEVGTRMHGFVNIFSAGMLAKVHNLDLSKAVEILSDEKPASFSFTNEGLYWCDLMLTDHEIVRLRQILLCSFGSCSFDEPREDLRALKMLQNAVEGSI